MYYFWGKNEIKKYITEEVVKEVLDMKDFRSISKEKIMEYNNYNFVRRN